jgi:DNA-binding IclR family transcriptional regulator
VKAGKSASRRQNFANWPSALMSHDVWVPGETVSLGPLSGVRERGHLDSVAKSAVRALDIIELLARAGTPLRAVEIGSELGLSPSSTHQLLKSMMDAAYLLFDPVSKRYRPSLRTDALGASLERFTFATATLGRLVAALHEKLGTTITVSASQGGFMQIIDVFEPGAARVAASHGSSDVRQKSIGLRVPIFGSCTGAAWLSVQSDEVILSVAKLCRRALGGEIDARHLLDIAERVRQRGYAFGGISPDDATRAIAAPLPCDPTGTVYVLATSAPAQEMSEHRDERAQILIRQIAEFSEETTAG